MLIVKKFNPIHGPLKARKAHLIKAVKRASDYKFTGRSANKDERKRELTARSNRGPKRCFTSPTLHIPTDVRTINPKETRGYCAELLLVIPSKSMF